MNGKCLSCHSPLSYPDLSHGYHVPCSKRLFGTARPPKVPFSTADIAVQAQKMVGRMSISGVQPKLSVTPDRKRQELTVVERGGRYILKPPTQGFDSLPENENLCMNIASAYGIEVPPHGLLPLKDDGLAYVVKRFDRLEDGSKRQQEDFQQLLETEDKYAGSYEKISKAINSHSDVPGLDFMALFERALLYFVLGNGDAHLKNFSMIRKQAVGYQLSPAYDIVSSRLVLPDEREEMCLSIQGKKNRLGLEDFKGLAEHFGLNAKQTYNALTRLKGLGQTVETMIADSLLGQHLKEQFVEIFKARMERLYG